MTVNTARALPICAALVLLTSQLCWSPDASGQQCGPGPRLQEEIAQKERVAMDAYFHKSPQDAAQVLSSFVDCLAFAGKAPTLDREFKLALKYDEMLARARLARVLRMADNPSGASAEEARALRVSKEAQMRIASSEELTALIKELDQKASTRY